VLVETPVFVGNQHAQELRIDITDRGLQPPAAFGRRKGAQKLAIGIQNLGGNPRLVERRWIGLVGGIEREQSRAGNDNAGDSPNRDLSARSHGCAATTSILPVAVRADSCGRYMSSTLAAGWS
jgi:hypothetical protein